MHPKEPTPAAVAETSTVREVVLFTTSLGFESEVCMFTHADFRGSS